MPNVGSIGGTFLVGIIVSLALFGILSSQTLYYFRTYPDDRLFLKFLITMLFFLETVHLAALGQATHYLFILGKFPENASKRLTIAYGTAVSLTTSFFVAFIVQSFYAWRIYRLSTWHPLGRIVAAFILSASVGQLTAGLTMNVLTYGNPAVDTMKLTVQRDSYSANLIMSIICDSTISISLVYFLSKMRTGFQASTNVINRLVIYSLQVGLFSSAIAGCTLVVFYTTPPTSVIYAALTEVQGKFYVNSMLVMLNSRKNTRQLLQETREIISLEVLRSQGLQPPTTAICKPHSSSLA